jgi:hypothetical protein
VSPWLCRKPSRNVEADFPPALFWLLGTACGLLIANVYYAQPLMGLTTAGLDMPRRSAV